MNKSEKYEHWRRALGALQGGRPEFRDQTPESMVALAKLVEMVDPTVVVEIGTNYGLSTRVWVDECKAQTKIFCIDFTFNPLKLSLPTVPMDIDRIYMIEREVTSVDLSQLWEPDDRVILFFDCHGPVPMQHMLSHVDSLPSGSVVVVDDMWYSDERLDGTNVEEFYTNTVLPTVDSTCPVRPQSYAPYWDGGSYYSFDEVVPLMGWLMERKQRAELHRPKTLWWKA